MAGLANLPDGSEVFSRGTSHLFTLACAAAAEVAASGLVLRTAVRLPYGHNHRLADIALADKLAAIAVDRGLPPQSLAVIFAEQAVESRSPPSLEALAGPRVVDLELQA